MASTNWLDMFGWGTQELNDLRHLAYCYIKEGVYPIALTIFDALAVLTPPTAYDLQTVGALHLQLGDGLTALDFLDRSLKIDPHHFPTQLNRAKALFILGYKKQGIMQATLLQECQDSEIAAQASALILSYGSAGEPTNTIRKK